MQVQSWYDPAPSKEIGEYAPQISNGQTLAKARKGGRKFNANPYALKEEELTPLLSQQLEHLQNFWTKPGINERKGAAIKEQTYRTYRTHILSYLGWLQNIQGEKPEQLSLERVADLERLQAFIDWGIQQKGNSYGWAMNITQTVISVAKWLYRKTQHKDFRDIPQIAALRDYCQTLREYYQEKRECYPQESSRYNHNQEQITPEEGRQIVEYLRQCCAPCNSVGIQRSETAILKSWERYLIVALLAYCPMRQREIRLLEWQRSLFRKQDGYWVQFDTKYKAGSKTGVAIDYLLPKNLTSDLDEWLQQWRPKIPTDHKLVFTRLGSNRTPESLGQPLTDRDISDLISSAIYKATSILFNKPTRVTPQSLRQLGLSHLKPISQLDQTTPVGGSSLDVVRQVQRVERHRDVASAERTSAIKQVQQAKLQVKEMQLKGKAMKNGAIRQVQQAKLQDCKNAILGHVATIFGELEQDSFFESTTEPNDFLESKAPEVSQSENAKPSRKKRSKKSKLD
jgi:integrase